MATFTLRVRAIPGSSPGAPTMNKKSIGLVVDNGADLPQDFIEKNQIEIVRHQVYFPEEDSDSVYQMGSKDFYRKMREKKVFPKTSFASIGSFCQVYQRALEKFENILAIILTSKHSGAYNAAYQAKLMMEEPKKIEVFDSLLVSVAEGLLAMKAQELINQNKKLPEILDNINEFREKIQTFGFLEDFSWAKAGGRIPEKIIKIIKLFQKRGIRLALGLKNGKIGIAGVRFSAQDRVEAIVNELKKVGQIHLALKTEGGVKVAIAQADVLSEAQRLKFELEKIGKKVLFLSELTPILVAHAGPGTLIVSYYLE